MNIKATIKEIFDVQQVSASFQKREFVVEYAENPQYPELIKFETIQDKCSLLDKFSAGQEVDVEFNLKGRAWTDKQGETKYFNSLQAWRVSATAAAAASPEAPAASGEAYSSDALSSMTDTNSDVEEGDLPF